MRLIRSALSGTLKFGNATNTKIHAADYKGFRFYNRVLTDEEIIINATADGNYDPDKAQPKGYVKVAQPDTGIVGDIAFSEYVTDKATMTRLTTAEVKPANLIFYIDEVNGELKAVDAAGKNAFATVKEIFTALDLKIIPTFYVKSETVAKAVCNYLKDDLYEDVFIMSSDPAIVKAARETYPLIRGIIDYSTKYHGALTEEQLIEVRRTVNTNLSKVVVLPWSAVTAENIDWLNDRAMTVWIDAGKVTEKTDAVKALLSGTYGIVSSSTEFLYTTCKEYIPAGTMTRMPVNVAHRGLFTQADENTLEAMIAAYNAGAEMVEIDIYLTTDGKLAINHNSTTTAIYDKSLTVENCTMAQLKELRSKKFGNQMPSLDEVFEYFKDKEMRFMIEIKSAKTGIVKVMKELIEQYDFYDRCTVITFSRTGMFDELMKVYPEMPVGYLTDAGNPSRNDPELAVKFAQNTVQPYNNTFAPNHSGYDGEYVKAALKRGITTWTWTISTQGLIYEYMLYGHTGITGNRTDYIGVLPQTLRSEMKNGETLLTGEAVKIPLQAESYAGKALVTSSARLAVQVLEGSAAVEGTTVTPTAPGKIVLLATYTHHMGNYTYTLTKTLELNAREPARVDVNGDKLINIQDVTTLLQYLVGEECEYVEEGLDVNGDKKVSVKDVSRLLAYLADSSVTIYP